MTPYLSGPHYGRAGCRLSAVTAAAGNQAELWPRLYDGKAYGEERTEGERQ